MKNAVLDESRPIWQAMVVFLVPLMLSNILQSASATLSSIFIGRLLGVPDLAAVSAIFPIIFFLISFLIGLGSGSTILIGQAFGARNLERVREVAGTTLLLTLVLGVAVAVFGVTLSPAILTAIGTPHSVIGLADIYARTVFALMPIQFVFLVYSTFLRGVGDTRTPFAVLAAAAALNLILTPAFILGAFGLPHLGLIGAALATGVSTLLALAGMFAYLIVVRHPLAPDGRLLGDVRVRPAVIAAVVRLGVPTGLQLVMVSLSEIAVISFVNRYGSNATASYGAVNQIVSYVQFPAISIGIASSIFGAQAIGAGKLDRIGRIVRSAVGLNYIVGGIIIALCYAFSWQLLGLFLTRPDTLNLAHALLAITLWSYLIFGNGTVLSAIMRSSGNVIWPTALSVVGIWAVEVPTAYVLSSHIGIDGIWIAYPIAYVVILVLQFAYYSLVWKRRPIVALK